MMTPFTLLGCAFPVNSPIEVGEVNITSSDHVLAVGEPPVTVIEYGDFECPVCGRFSRETYPDIKRDYIDTGKVRWVFRHFPLSSIHEFALRAAEAAECAAGQEMFWEYSDLLFENQSALTDSDLIAYAGDLGLNLASFEACMQSGEKLAGILEDRESGLAIGVPGTPSFVIGNRLYARFFSLEEFSRLIDESILEASGSKTNPQ
jgi:protein-disulfide isomerase